MSAQTPDERAVTSTPMLGIVVAFAHEATLVRRRLPCRRGGRTPGGRLWSSRGAAHNVVLIQSGMGPTHAACAATWLIRHYTLHALISVGFAGGLQDGLHTGTAVIPTHVGPEIYPPARAPRDAWLTPDARLSHLALQAVQHTTLPWRQGLLLSTATVCSEVTTKTRLGERSGALAVDMESFSVGQVATRHGLPFIALRTIFDVREEALPALTWQCTTDDGSLQWARLILYLAMHPHALGQPWQLWRKARYAGRNLTTWLGRFLTLLHQDGR